MATSKGFKPQNLRTLLSALLAIVILGGGALFYFGLEQVRAFAIETNNRLADAEASDKQIEQLQALRNQLAQSQALITKADQMFTTQASYQAQAFADVRNYANQAGVAVTSTDFEDPTTGSYTMILRLNNPVNYGQLIQFLKLMEGNLPKMQVTSISLAPSTESSLVQVEEIKVNIFVR